MLGMTQSSTPIAPARAAAVGLLSLAAAMGIGRFAFTPMLPLMQAQAGLTLAEGAWLAAANYLGYLVGALASLWLAPRPAPAARGGLVAVALFTLLMAGSDHRIAWLVWRFAAGVASAWVLVGVSGWALAQLAAAGRSALGGVVFAGVGAGIAAAGLLVLAAAALPPPWVWCALGLLAAAVVLFTWPAFGREVPTPAPAQGSGGARLGASAWALVVSYGLFGLGYIVPATFLPALARERVSDPLLFGLAWPLFGLAALASTVIVARLAAHRPPRQLALVAHVVMAAGVLAPVLDASLAAILVSALCVGGTFMVATMAGLQEARRLAAASPTRLMSAMTAAFALGQLVGPLLLSGGGQSASSAMRMPSLVAAALLIVGALLLAFVKEKTP